MNAVVSELLDLLCLERLERNLFRGQSRDIGSKRVFGGQVLGQALVAASRTVEDRLVHSLHAYFLRAGDIEAPIVYDVDRSRDGRSFTNRRVVAIQHGRPILNMACSFQRPEDGLEHQTVMPDVPGPEDVPVTVDVDDAVLRQMPEKLQRFMAHRRAFEFRHVEAIDPLHPEKRPPLQHMWFRMPSLPDDQPLHRALLTYMSDYYLVSTAILPHGVSFVDGSVQLASLDHAMWFHCDVRLDDWLLFAYDSPSAHGARGLARGSVFTRDGTLVASTAQEGLIRLRSDRTNA